MIGELYQPASQSIVPYSSSRHQWQQCTHHGIGKRSWNSYHHPPYNPNEEVPPLPSYQIDHEPSIQLCDVQTDEGTDIQEEAMANEKPHLFTLPAGNDNLQ